MFFYLKSVNRILRWTGFRIYVGLDEEFLKDSTNNSPKTRIGIAWYGFGFIKDLANDLLKD